MKFLDMFIVCTIAVLRFRTYGTCVYCCLISTTTISHRWCYKNEKNRPRVAIALRRHFCLFLLKFQGFQNGTFRQAQCDKGKAQHFNRLNVTKVKLNISTGSM